MNTVFYEIRKWLIDGGALGCSSGDTLKSIILSLEYGELIKLDRVFNFDQTRRTWLCDLLEEIFTAEGKRELHRLARDLQGE